MKIHLGYFYRKRKLFISTRYKTEELQDAIINQVNKRATIKKTESEARRTISLHGKAQQKLAS